jgi:hypothetical protein
MKTATAVGACVLAALAWAGVARESGEVPNRPIRCGVVDPPAAPAPERIEVDLVICLDTSGSMTGLIDSARARLWDIVNEFGQARPMPKLRVGLLTYGSPNLANAAQGFVVRQIDLTDDLDSVYAKMMSMTTNGGAEYVGWVLNDAVRTLSWSRDPRALRLIYVAGNESADQAAEQFNFRRVSQIATGQDIVINAIYAGDRSQGISEMWEAVAQHGGGTYAAIEMNEATYQIPAPQDVMLQKLNIELNATYIPYGARGREGRENQLAQDGNAERMGGQSAGSRVAAKASRLYSNSFWDLVDAVADKDFRLDSVDKEELPEAMQSMTPAERDAYVNGMRAARDTVQQKIKKLSEERDEFLRQERARQKSGDSSGLDDALLESIHKHAKKKGFEFSGE